MDETVFDPIDPILGEFQITDSLSASGRRSHGSVRFEPHGLFAHSHAVLNQSEAIYGLAALFRGRLIIATGPKDKVEIGAYHSSGDRLTGIWVPPGAKGRDLAMCGREVSRRTGDNTYEIQQAHAVDQMPYTGRLTLSYAETSTVHVRSVKFNWSLHDGEYASFGLAVGEILVSTFNFQAGTPFAIGVYEPHGPAWRGTIAHSPGDKTSQETLKR